MKVFPLLALLPMAAFLFGEETLPLEELASDSFAAREKAESEVKNWAARNPATARERLLKIYLGSDDPEFRHRLLAALERAYFAPKGYVGIQMMPARYDQFGRLRPPGGDNDLAGVVVTAVVPGSPAERSGLQAGDVIVKIDDWKAEGEEEVTAAVAREIQKNSPGSVVTLKTKRGKEWLEMKLELGILPIPSERARLMRASPLPNGIPVSADVAAQIEEFRQWLLSEIEKDRKNLIADRR